jgi:hypothetical protein
LPVASSRTQTSAAQKHAMIDPQREIHYVCCQ